MKALLVTATIGGFLVLGGCRDPASKAEKHFQYCLGAAHPADAEAIKACREAAESIAVLSRI